jgi:hypothetical protein
MGVFTWTVFSLKKRVLLEAGNLAPSPDQGEGWEGVKNLVEGAIP